MRYGQRFAARAATSHAWCAPQLSCPGRATPDLILGSEDPGPRSYTAKSMDIETSRRVAPGSHASRVYPTCVRSRADLGQARDRCLASLARDTRSLMPRDPLMLQDARCARS